MGKLRIVGQEQSACSVEPEVNALPPDGTQAISGRRYAGKAAIITLGCAKNHVDSEVMLGVLNRSGFEIVGEVNEADVAIVNTCGFLQSAVKESIDCILDVADLKKTARLRKLVVAGCAVERYQDPAGKGGTLQEALPEVDAFISVNDILKVADAARLEPADGASFEAVLEEGARPYFLYDDSMPRALASKPHYAYVKVSEGCNRPCTFCIIPKIRGPMRSRTIESVVREVEALGAMGVREVNLVAQDLTSFGLDQKGSGDTRSGRQLVELLRAIDKARAVDWVRLLYAYPVGTTEELLETIVSLPTICNYLDIPLQHASERVLKVMKRPIGKFAPRPMVEFIRRKAPEIAIRTTFIVGFPGETDEDVDELEAFIAEGHFSNVGVFTYSQEEGTPSGAMAGQIPERIKKQRRARLMKAQQKVARRRNQELVGTRLPILIEGAHEESDILLTGRTSFQAPEVDGSVIINDAPDGVQLLPGTIATAEITDVLDYDLIARIEAVEEGVLVGREIERA